jgi:uncharacterized protein with NAD-binding domain and iron-sulfur cluster
MPATRIGVVGAGIAGLAIAEYVVEEVYAKP